MIFVVWSLIGMASAVGENATSYPSMREIKCASSFTDMLLSVLNLLGFVCSVPFLYSSYRSSKCKFRLSKSSRDGNDHEIEGVSIDLKVEGERDGTSL